MKPKSNNRWRLFADFKLQGILCLRFVIYWIICQASIFGTVLLFVSLHPESNTAGAIWQFLTPAFIVSSIILPIIMLDLLIFSNRFAGPVWNFRRKLQEFAETGKPVKVHFRQRDFFQDMSCNFNKLCEKTLADESEK